MMKFKVLFLLGIISLMSFSVNAQRGVRIGYIDTEYILQNVPEYQEASTQLDKKVQQWKSDIEKKLSVIEQKKKELENESVLLTKELYEERMEDIAFEEAEILDYQQKRFGPDGDLIIQKRQLIEPVQDQIFAAVQQVAESQKFDFVFDKSADVVMLYSAERYDVSDRVLNIITRSSKRSQAKNKKERKALEEEEIVPVAKNDKDERQKALDERKAEREALLAKKREEREQALAARRAKQDSIRAAKKQEADARRQKILNDRKNESETSDDKQAETSNVKKDSSSVAKGAKNPPGAKNSNAKGKETKKDSVSTNKPLTAAEIKARDRERRKKALEEKKQKIIEQRKKAREERIEQLKKRDSIAKAKKKEGENN